MKRARFWEEAPHQAEAMLALVERTRPGALIALREDPLAALTEWSAVQVKHVPESTAGDRCSVAGGYQHWTTPPTLLVEMSSSRRRQGFTALHELGHHLQKTDDGLGQLLFQRNDSEAFEDAACDAFASRVLLPDSWVAERIGSRGPGADDVVRLFLDSRASREACCVRAAEHLRGAGAVVLLDRRGVVQFAAPRGIVPPARGSDQSSSPLVEAALRSPGTTTRHDTHYTWRDGRRSDQFYGQAAWCDDHLIVVLASDNVPWLSFAPPRPDTSTSKWSPEDTCETCDEPLLVFEERCPQCQEPRCGDGHCGCTTKRLARDRMCGECFLLKPPSSFNGTSAICRDCA